MPITQHLFTLASEGRRNLSLLLRGRQEEAAERSARGLFSALKRARLNPCVRFQKGELSEVLVEQLKALYRKDSEEERSAKGLAGDDAPNEDEEDEMMYASEQRRCLVFVYQRTDDL